MPIPLRSSQVIHTAPIVKPVVRRDTPSAVAIPGHEKLTRSLDAAVVSALSPSLSGSSSPTATLSDGASPARVAIQPATSYRPPVLASDRADTAPIEKLFPEHGQFKALGDLKGISQQRPVLLAAFDFLPAIAGAGTSGSELGDHSLSLTPAGEYAFQQWWTRLLVKSNCEKLLTELSAYPSTKSAIDGLFSTFSSDLPKALAPVFELADAVSELNFLKRSLDFSRYERYALPSSSLKRFAGVKSLSTTVADVFTGDLHFVESAFRTFANTKVLFQLVSDLGQFSKSYSYSLVRADTTARSSDVSTTAVIRSPGSAKSYLTRFGSVKLDTGNLLTSYVASPDGFLSSLVSAYTQLLKLAPTDIGERLTVLSLTLSREWRASAGLADPGFRRRLSGYGIDADSGTVIDDLLGDTPSDATDPLPPQKPISLSNAIQFSDADVGVLPFESKYLDTKSGVYTPGSSYLVDPVLSSASGKPDTSRLVAFARSTERSISALNDVFSGLQLTSITLHGSNSEQQPDLYLVSLVAKFASAIAGGIDLQGGQSPSTKGEMLSCVMSLAANDALLRSLLFSLFVFDSFASQSSPDFIDQGIVSQAKTGVLGRIADRVNSLLAVSASPPKTFNSLAKSLTSAISSTPTTVSAAVGATGTAVATRYLSDDDVRRGLDNEAFSALSSAFRSLLSSFESSSAYTDGDRTRFSGVQKGALWMLMFEMLLCAAYKFSFSKFKISAGNVAVETDVTASQSFKLLMDRLSASQNPGDQFAASAGPASQAASDLRSIVQKLSDEEKAVARLHLALSSVFLPFLTRARAVISSFDPTNGKHAALLRSLSQVISPKVLSLVDDQQVYLSTARAFELMSQAGSKSLTSLDGSVPGYDTIASLAALLSQKKFQRPDGDDTKVLCVGIPAGFSRYLQEREKPADVKDPSLSSSRARDVVRVNVYRRDFTNPDIVFKPQRFLFELTRFVSPVLSFSDVALSKGVSEVTFADVMENVKFLEMGSPRLSRQSPPLAKLADSELETSDDYSFLSNGEKREVAENHVTSSLLSEYVKLMTGVKLEEHFYPVNGEPDDVSLRISNNVMKLLIDTRVRSVTGKFSFDSSRDSIDSLSLSQLAEDKLRNDVKHLGVLGIARTNVGDPVKEAAEALVPKTFERVFCVPLNPDKMQIDEKKTTATEFGKAALSQLVAAGRVSSDLTLLRSQENVSIDQYFVTVETVLGTEV